MHRQGHIALLRASCRYLAGDPGQRRGSVSGYWYHAKTIGRFCSARRRAPGWSLTPAAAPLWRVSAQAEHSLCISPASSASSYVCPSGHVYTMNMNTNQYCERLHLRRMEVQKGFSIMSPAFAKLAAQSQAVANEAGFVH